ncbi:hypothetical protein H8B09_30100 [Paenibacillus sp. PR3]|uniref:Copper amine oxidase-like N-terminal domain-containing protein n=1 Tax=Paenibacillus terricola TaxID=2763503 RepID=A0ABR8N483_9BACL|nr:hypothetical protein [Paenibacillus terricola]MBD3922982.1 hypothetical protein [Paenibacillus terricola]
MKMKIALLSGIALSLIIAGTAMAADAKKVAKIKLNGIQDSKLVKMYNDKYTGMDLPAELIDGTLYFKIVEELPFLRTWGYFPDNWAAAGFDIDGKTDVSVTTGSKTYIDLLGLPQTISNTVKNQLKRHFFPVRYVYELAGYKVDYDAAAKTVTISE